jgi:PAS domain S-box-containing protein
VPELCLVCGSCVRACPQGAKTIREDRPLVERALAEGRLVIATVAPSAPAYFGMKVFSQIEDVLRKLGFAGADETAFGAEMVALAHKECVQSESERWPVIASSCPVVVNLIEQYYPALIPHLAPVVSPMIAHGRWLREKHGQDAFIVFIGPCIAKKREAEEPAVAGVVDAALTFQELSDWMKEKDLDLPESDAVAGAEQQSMARLFPVEGGLVGTANMDTDMLSSHVVVASGLDAVEEVLRGIQSNKLSACMVELLACSGGCVNGPAMMGVEGGAFLARQRVIEYASHRGLVSLPARADWPSMAREYSDNSVPIPAFTEEQIQEVLHKVEKYTPEDELNCAACGYPTCRDKAVATLRGMAEATMCIPYMRRRADSLRQVVMDVTPNAIIIVDRDLRIQDMSPSAERMFGCHLNHVQGQDLKAILPVVDDFLQVRATGVSIMGKTIQLRSDLFVEQTIVRVEDENLLMGILRDVTDREQQREKLDRIRTETLQRTQEVVSKQMRVAHEIAQLLGETTAESKMMVSRLAKLLGEGNTK